MHLSCSRWIAAAITFCVLLSGCQADDIVIPLPTPPEASSAVSSSANVAQSNADFVSSPIPSEPIQLEQPDTYDLQVAAETAVRADIDATPILKLPLNNLTTLFLSYTFADSDVMVQAHPENPNLLLFYERDTENRISRIYQYSLSTSDFILLNQLGFSAVDSKGTFWAGTFFCHLSNIVSSDEQINLERALCCFNTQNNKWSFYPMDEKKQAYPTPDGKILIFTPRFDGSREIIFLDPATLEAVSSFSLSGKEGITSFAYVCPDSTVIFSSVTTDGTLYTRYSQDGTLLSQCLGNPDIPDEELIYYRLYQAVPTESTREYAPVISSFRLDDKDYVMPWRPVSSGQIYPAIYARQEVRFWNGLHLISRSDGWSLWQPLYSVKGTPDFLLWKEETNFWQYVELDTSTTELTILRTVPVSENRILLQTRNSNGQVIWKMLKLSDFYPEL